MDCCFGSNYSTDLMNRLADASYVREVISFCIEWAEIGEIIAGLKPGRQSDEEITIFTSTGLAVQDAVTAKIAYDKALKKEVGSFTTIA